MIEQFVSEPRSQPRPVLLLAQVIIFLLGWPLEWTEIIVIFLPLFLPLLDNFDIDPLFFGIMVALNLQTSFLSPPIAMSPFYLKGVAPKGVTIEADLRRRHAVPWHRRGLPDHSLRLPGGGAVAARRGL